MKGKSYFTFLFAVSNMRSLLLFNICPLYKDAQIFLIVIQRTSISDFFPVYSPSLHPPHLLHKLGILEHASTLRLIIIYIYIWQSLSSTKGYCTTVPPPSPLPMPPLNPTARTHPTLCCTPPPPRLLLHLVVQHFLKTVPPSFGYVVSFSAALCKL